MSSNDLSHYDKDLADAPPLHRVLQTDAQETNIQIRLRRSLGIIVFISVYLVCALKGAQEGNQQQQLLHLKVLIISPLAA